MSEKEKDISAQFPGVFIVHQKVRGYEVDTHEHEDHEIFIPLQGEIQLDLDDRTLKAGAGKMIYLPPGTAHSFRSDSHSSGERLILIVESKVWERNEGGKFKAQTLVASQLCKELIVHLLINPKTKATQALIQTLLQTLSEMLEGAAHTLNGESAHFSGRVKDRRVRAALQIIEDSFASPPPISKIAKDSGMSLRTFNRLFLTEVGLTPKQALTYYRIEKSKSLLKLGRHSVTDVALETGYSSLSQFIATFRKLTGQLPSEFLPAHRL